jgi:hypothetical protein
MPPIVSGITYVDGALLVPDNHNAHMASATTNVGIVTVPNGNIETTNLDASFKIAPEHVQVEQACAMRKESNTETLDFMNDAFSSADGTKYWTPIAGLSRRFYNPFLCDCAIVQWTAFFSIFRYFLEVPNGTNIIPAIAIVTAIDGSNALATWRNLPVTKYYNSAAPDPGGKVWEDRACVTIDMTRMVKSFLSGDRTISVKLYMEAASQSSDISRTVNGVSASTSHSIFNRLTIGIRNTRMMRFL